MKDCRHEDIICASVASKRGGGTGIRTQISWFPPCREVPCMNRLRVIAPVSHHLSANPLAITPITGASEDTVLPHTPIRVYRFRIFCFRFRRRIFFFLHFHRCFPRFFHTRELRFIDRPQRLTGTTKDPCHEPSGNRGGFHINSSACSKI